MKKIFWLLVSIVILILGFYQNNRYEYHSITVNATVTKVDTYRDDDEGPIKYHHTYYGKYTVNGKTYKNKKLASNYTDADRPSHPKGSTIEIRVNSKNPDKKVPEGGIFIVVGVLMTIYNFITLSGNRTETTAENTNKKEADT